MTAIHTAVYILETAVFILVVIAGDAYRGLHTSNRGIYITHRKKNFKNRSVLEEHRDVAWTTEINSGCMNRGIYRSGYCRLYVLRFRHW